MQIDRMALADCGSPERLLLAIFKQIPQMRIPVPLEEIAAEVGIKEIRTLETDGFEGGLIATASKSEGAILVNKRSPRPRRRFTIGHELGHFLIPAHRPIDQSDFRCTQRDFTRTTAKPTDRAAQMEVEANRFSGGLLMPTHLFRRDMERLRGMDIDHILQLSLRYEASKEATTRKYVDVHEEPCAAIISQHGKIMRIYRQSNFPFVSRSPGEDVPPSSATAQYDGAIRKPTSWQEADTSDWLANDRYCGRIIEQVLVQANGFRITLLAIDDPEPDEDSDDESVKDAWAVRFPSKR
jgi:Zn-dependent peptidase ImmA (M78 family)